VQLSKFSAIGWSLFLEASTFLFGQEL